MACEWCRNSGCSAGKPICASMTGYARMQILERITYSCAGVRDAPRDLRARIVALALSQQNESNDK